MIIGYARVSTEEQKLDLQLSALEKAGCDRIFQDRGCSGHHFQRDGLEAALGSLKPGGTLVVWRLDRLGRSLSGLVRLIDLLGERGAHFISVMENIDTGSSSGRLMFHMMAALAEFERALISERTRAGLAEAKTRGKAIGRPNRLTELDVHQALQEVHDEGLKMFEAAERLGVSVRTLQRHLRKAREKPDGERSDAPVPTSRPSSQVAASAPIYISRSNVEGTRTLACRFRPAP